MFEAQTPYSNVKPVIASVPAKAHICQHCRYVNHTQNNFCTYCGYAFKNEQLSLNHEAKFQQLQTVLDKAESAVLIARIVLYMMGIFFLLGIFFLFDLSRSTAFIFMTVMFSGLFFLLASWSRRNPFTAILTAFLILVSFSLINILGRFTQSFTSREGVIGIAICVSLLFVLLRGVQGAYRANIIKQKCKPG